MKVVGKEFVPKEKVAEGRTFEPTGEILEKGFNVEWSGHHFSDDEVERLLQGEEITITTAKGNDVNGKLAKDKYKGREYWGFQPEKRTERKKLAVGRRFEPTGEILEKGFNAEWSGHHFSDDEVERLLQGKEIIVISNQDKPIPGVLGQSQYKGHKFWGFQPGIPNTLAGHNFTEDEKEKMYAGESVFAEDFWSTTKAKYYSAWVSWDWIDLDVIMDFDDYEPITNTAAESDEYETEDEYEDEDEE